jgi:group I intron endonuclease
MACGIYKILNSVTGKCYVGQSVDIETRWFGNRGHFYWLERNCHSNYKLQRSWNKHGKEAFKFEILQECKDDQLDWLEAFWMTKLDSVDNGYNIQRVYIEDGKICHRHAETTIQKMRNRYTPEIRSKMSLEQSERERNRSPEEKRAKSERISLALTGKPKKKCTYKRKMSEEAKKHLSEIALLRPPMSEETRRKISEASKGKIISDWQKQRISASASYRVYSLEAREAISKTHLGSKRSNEAKAKMSASKIGKVHSEETKLKMSKAAIGRKASEETLQRMSEAAKKREEVKRLRRQNVAI